MATEPQQKKPKTRKPGRGGQNKDLPITVHCPKALLEKLGEVLQRWRKEKPFAKISRSDVIRQAIEFGLKEIEGKMEKEGRA